MVQVPSSSGCTENDGLVPTQSAMTAQSVTVQVTSLVPGACSTVKKTNGPVVAHEEPHFVAVTLGPGHGGPPAADHGVVGQGLDDLRQRDVAPASRTCSRRRPAVAEGARDERVVMMSPVRAAGAVPRTCNQSLHVLLGTRNLSLHISGRGRARVDVEEEHAAGGRGKGGKPTTNRTWSGRPGSNRHGQLGRLKFCH